MEIIKIINKLIKNELLSEKEYQYLKQNWFIARRFLASRRQFALVSNTTNLMTFKPEMIADYLKIAIPIVASKCYNRRERYIKFIFPKKKEKKIEKELRETCLKLGFDYKNIKPFVDEVKKDLEEKWRTNVLSKSEKITKG